MELGYLNQTQANGAVTKSVRAADTCRHEYDKYRKVTWVGIPVRAVKHFGRHAES